MKQKPVDARVQVEVVDVDMTEEEGPAEVEHEDVADVDMEDDVLAASEVDSIDFQMDSIDFQMDLIDSQMDWKKEHVLDEADMKHDVRAEVEKEHVLAEADIK